MAADVPISKRGSAITRWAVGGWTFISPIIPSELTSKSKFCGASQFQTVDSGNLIFIISHFMTHSEIYLNHVCISIITHYNHEQILEES